MSKIIFLALLALGNFEFGSGTTSVEVLELKYLKDIVIAEKTGAECPKECPPGFQKWGPLKNCYMLPVGGLMYDNFFNSSKWCTTQHPDAYPLVFNEPLEVIYRLANGADYIPDLFKARGLDAFVWLGAFKNLQNKWQVLDGSSAKHNMLIKGANLLKSKPFDCLVAELHSLGLLPSTRRCDSPLGVVICEITTQCPGDPVFSGNHPEAEEPVTKPTEENALEEINDAEPETGSPKNATTPHPKATEETPDDEPETDSPKGHTTPRPKKGGSGLTLG